MSRLWSAALSAWIYSRRDAQDFEAKVFFDLQTGNLNNMQLQHVLPCGVQQFVLMRLFSDQFSCHYDDRYAEHCIV